MPQYHSRRHKYKFNKWNKNTFVDDRQVEGSGDHLRMHRDQGGRRSLQSDVVRRAVAMNLLPTPSGSPGTQNSGTGPGESWARITVVFGAAHSFELLQELINTACETQLRFYNTCIEGRNVVTYAKIREKQLAKYRKALQSLRNPSDASTLDGDITLVPEPRVLPSTAVENGMQTPLPESWTAALRACFLQRYQANTRSLDLSSVHTDPSLLSQGLYLPLNKKCVINAMVGVLKENAAQLSLLNLSGNRLPHTHGFFALATKNEDNNNVDDNSCGVRIERIDLSANPLNGCSALAGLRGIAGLVELDVTDTPLATRIDRSDPAALSTITKILPGLKRLNGRELPQNVQFEIEQTSRGASNSKKRMPLPDSVAGYFPSDDVRIPLLIFLKDYLSRYDTKPRADHLLPYYTPASQLVLSVAPECHVAYQNVPSVRLDDVGPDGNRTKTIITTSRLQHSYLSRSRNVLRCTSELRLADYVARGATACANLLGDLPPTEHPLEPLSVDVTFHSASQILFTVTGIFYELHQLDGTEARRTSASVRKLLRCFSRTMIIVAPGGQIVQDDYTISSPSIFLCRKHITASNASQSTTTTTNTTTTTPILPPSAPAGPSSDTVSTQQSLLNELRQRTGMNEAFSRQCLDEYQWNLESALSAFQTLNSAGRLPAEAFS